MSAETTPKLLLDVRETCRALGGISRRQFFVTREVAADVLEHLPPGEHRLLFLLARYLGIRVTSEMCEMTWRDVNWKSMTVVIHLPKTAHHKGGEKRVCPIFPEVQAELQEAFHLAPEGAEHVFPTLRALPEGTLRGHLDAAILRAGRTPWPKAWINLRATRATELADQFPSHVAAAWLGHTEAIANSTYRQVTTDHMARAISTPTGAMPEKPAQQPQELVCKGVTAAGENPGISRHFPMMSRGADPKGARCRSRGW